MCLHESHKENSKGVVYMSADGVSIWKEICFQFVTYMQKRIRVLKTNRHKSTFSTPSRNEDFP